MADDKDLHKFSLCKDWEDCSRANRLMGLR
jgi:hypothetical protein